jgi:antitoxin CptB
VNKLDIKVNFTPEDLKRMYWHSRRGMLELDLLLIPFAEKYLNKLTVQELELYKQLLEEEDQDLFVWLTQRKLAPTKPLQTIVAMVLASNAELGKQ